jgi:hypothetical protein
MSHCYKASPLDVALHAVSPSSTTSRSNSPGLTPIGEADKRYAVTYRYEAMLPEHFQRLCQMLLLPEHPDLQCLPVGMPDGGRDMFAGDQARGTTVIQVKFAREPEKIANHAQWAIDALVKELDKIKKLKERGTTKYILVTNVGGTSHLDGGSIDRVQRYLDENLPMPAQCLWRNDLDIRLASRTDLKLHFPALLSGEDALALVLQTSERESRERRERIIRAYLADQMRAETSLRFKQADLPETLLFDLFIDVPVAPDPVDPHGPERDSLPSTIAMDLARRKARRTLSIARHSQVRSASVVHPGRIGIPADWDAHWCGGADLILDSDFAQHCRFSVIEGAPGQGKSTLTQYVAQLHRARLLQKLPRTEIDQTHRHSSIAMPLRLELRHLAQWLRGINPWSSSSPVDAEYRTLEAAIAGHISKFSGGSEFTTDDLLAIGAESAIVVLLDGLDEVADLDDRRRVVEEVSAGIERMATNMPRLQAVVTSRPNAIADAPRFSHERFAYVRLAPIPKNLAIDYAERWIKARRLNETDANAVIEILRDKLESPHIATLAQNTMQLSILLNLIHARGAGLPDKRTELYSTYVDVFFNRESEKDSVVKKHRELLLSIHYYLGFYLHAQAEGDRSNGTISATDLHNVLLDYLKQEQRPTTIVDELFRGTLERVAALVSRVQGTYEFEVQPLREFFAAKHLYTTKPYSPTGREHPGSLPDRFDAIAPRSYWANVTRFFAGCFDRGELLGLADRVVTLINQGERTFARWLAICLLNDLVFTQSVRATHEVVDHALDLAGIIDIYFRNNFNSHRTDDIQRILNDEARAYACERFWMYLIAEPGGTETSDCLALALRVNMEHNERVRRWTGHAAGLADEQLGAWIAVGLRMDVFFRLPSNELRKICNRITRIDLLARMAAAGAQVNEVDVRVTASAIADTCATPGFYHASPTPLESFATALDSSLLAHLIASNRMFRERFEWTFDISATPLPGDLGDFMAGFKELLESGVLATDMEVWRRLDRHLENSLGSPWKRFELANLAAGIRNAAERGAGARSLFDDVRALPDRVRAARRRAKDGEWWQKQLELAANDQERAFWALVLVTWADQGVLGEKLVDIDAVVQSLDSIRQRTLWHTVSIIDNWSIGKRSSLGSVSKSSIVGLSPYSISVLWRRFSLEQQLAVVTGWNGDFAAPHVASSYGQLALYAYARSSIAFDQVVPLLQAAVVGGAHIFVEHSIRERLLNRGDWAPVVESTPNMPLELVIHAAVNARRVHGRRRVRERSVIEVAASEGWFDSL